MPHRRPLWLPLHCAAARYARLRSVPRQPKPPRKEQHQENSRSSLPFSFSPCSLIKSTKTVSEMLARRGLSKGDYNAFEVTNASSYCRSCFFGGVAVRNALHDCQGSCSTQFPNRINSGPYAACPVSNGGASPQSFHRDKTKYPAVSKCADMRATHLQRSRS